MRRAEAAPDRFVEVSLLEGTAYGCYAPYDLVRDFARELTREPTRGPASEPAPTLLPESAGEPGLRGHLASA
ncbi:hypothetical protein [Streptomyces incanus]